MNKKFYFIIIIFLIIIGYLYYRMHRMAAGVVEDSNKELVKWPDTISIDSLNQK